MGPAAALFPLDFGVKAWFKFVTVDGGIGFRRQVGEGCSPPG